MLNFRFGGSEWYYQGGRDPELGRHSLGFVLQVHAVREALNEGMQSYRFLRGEELYKRRFTNADTGVVTIRVDNVPDTGQPIGVQAVTPDAKGTVRSRLRRDAIFSSSAGWFATCSPSRCSGSGGEKRRSHHRDRG